MYIFLITSKLQGLFQLYCNLIQGLVFTNNIYKIQCVGSGAYYIGSSREPTEGLGTFWFSAVLACSISGWTAQVSISWLDSFDLIKVKGFCSLGGFSQTVNGKRTKQIIMYTV